MAFILGVIFWAGVFAVSTSRVSAAEGDILLFDDFNDGNLDGWTIESGQWWINSGNLAGAKSGKAYGGRINTGSSEWDNYHFELDVNGFSGIDQGVGFRYTQSGSYEVNLRYGTGAYDTPQVKLWRNNGNEDWVLLTDTHSFPLVNQKWYHVKIEVLNENIKVWIDNTLIFDFNDPGTKIKKGTVTLSYWTGDISGAYMRFDNTRVTALAPSKTPVIFIPGIGGSEMKASQDIIWSKDNGHGGTYSHSYGADEKIWVNQTEAVKPGDDDYFDVLRMKTDGITSEADIELTGNLYGGAYQQTVDFFTSNGYTLNADLFVFPYDWRKDLSGTAGLLDDKIQSIKQQTGAQKVDIVAHSMGGLVARNYIADPNRASNVRKLITLGTPHLGAIKFLRTLQYGGCLTKPGVLTELSDFDICLGLSPSEIKDVIQNMISSYELVPSQKYYDFYSGEDNLHPLPFNDARDIDNNGTTGPLNYNQTKTFLTNLNYNTDFFNPAETFHKLDNNLDKTNEVDVNIIAGSGINTLGQIIERNIVDFLGIKIPKKDALIINGDETVPLLSASLTDMHKNISLLGSAKIYYTQQKHGNLVSDGPAMKLVKNILDGKSEFPSGVSLEPYKLTGQQLSVHSPVLLHAYDSSNNHTGPLSNGNYEASIPGSSYEVIGDAKFIWLSDNGQYNLKFEATDQGSFDFKIRTYENNENSKTVVYNNIPLTAQTKAETVFDTSSINPPLLSLDIDGNGVIDTQVGSTGITSGSAAADNTAPETLIALTGDKSSGGSYKTDVKIELSPTDNTDGSGIAKTEYSLDNGQTIKTYTESFTVSENGTTRIKYRSTDNAGNTEDPKGKEVIINKPSGSSDSNSSSSTTSSTTIEPIATAMPAINIALKNEINTPAGISKNTNSDVLGTQVTARDVSLKQSGSKPFNYWRWLILSIGIALTLIIYWIKKDKLSLKKFSN